MTPIIAVTAGRSPGEDRPKPNAHGRIRPVPARVHVNECVLDAIKGHGADVILLPPEPANVDKTAAWVLEHCHGLVITGGNFDIHPSLYGQDVDARIDRVDTGRTALELALAKEAITHDFPVLGICGGMQAMAVAAGGTLYQDIRTQIPGAMEHEQTTSPTEPWHPITIDPGLIRKAFGCSILRVNSTHHQAVNDPGSFVVTARAPDGVIEAIEHPANRCCVGVQWHPELIDPAPLRMLTWFAANPK